jgi:phosphatidylserine decarboxylase
MITRYGYDVFFVLTGIYLVIILLALFLIEPRFLKFGTVVVALALFGFTLNFFRDPDRTPPDGEGLILAPADGRIIKVATVRDDEFFGGDDTIISIFMSPLNVHVNRNPITGVVKHMRYVEGEYFAAFEDKASEKNEQMIVGLENSSGKVLMKQIAGFVARRIVCELAVGDSIQRGERFGMIKFGSRVDVFVPTTSAIKIRVDDRTVAGETILAVFHE